MGKRSKKPFINSKEDREIEAKEECEENKVDEEDLAFDVKKIDFLNGAIIDVIISLIDK